MAVIVRLHRAGSNKQPFYRIVAADTRGATAGKTLEILGWYDPRKKHDDLKIDLVRVEYWKGVGARLSDTVRTLLKSHKATATAAAAAPGVS
ncbi:MAG: 30S ribosomal protein S16 [Verrucomicrobia bacterium A1]|nr:MAG: 30S ribosomal protein S16 [Verrucomicrobia bacterium A1]